MLLQESTEIQSPEIRKEAFLSRLPQADQANLANIGAQFKRIMTEEGRQGALIVIGGTLDKPLPRKDIDIKIVLQPHPEDVQKGKSTELEFAQKDFRVFHHIVQRMIDGNPLLEITAVTEPAMDEEFDSPNILKTDGSMVVASKYNEIMPIEFVRSRERGDYTEIAAKRRDRRPFIILEHT